MTPIPTKMKGLLLTQPGKIEPAELDVPRPGPDEVLVRVAACGVCNATDLKIFKGINQSWNRGKYPCTMGHEVTGTVAALGKEVKGFHEGDRVFMRIARTGFAEYCTWRADHVRPLPDPVGFPEGTLGQLMPIGVRAIEKSMTPGDRVLVAGAGPAGMLCLMMARACGARQVIVTEVSPFRIALARRLGADAVINIRYMTTKAKVPPHLKGKISDPTYGARIPLLRKASGSVRITIFKGGHEIVTAAALTWLSKQEKRGQEPFSQEKGQVPLACAGHAKKGS